MGAGRALPEVQFVRRMAWSNLARLTMSPSPEIVVPRGKELPGSALLARKLLLVFHGC
jgi:hypothetical protein